MNTLGTSTVLGRKSAVAAALLVTISSSARGQVVFRASISAQGQQFSDSSVGRVSADGRYAVMGAPSTAFSEIQVPTWPGLQIVRRNLSTGAVDIVSRDESGQIVPQSNWTFIDAVNADGAVVAFSSDSALLVSGDTNGFSDVFVRDYNLGILERVSTTSNGHQGDGVSYGASLSSDGRFVAFISDSWNFTGGPYPSQLNVYVKDRQLGTIRMANVNSAGAPANVATPSFCVGWFCNGPKHAMISGNGRFVVFDSVANNLSPFDLGWFPDMYVHDLATGITELASATHQGSSSTWGMARFPSISDDGRYVTFQSDGDDLVPGLNPGEFLTRVYRRDMVARVTELVDVDPSGAPASLGSSPGAISRDGRYVAFGAGDPLAPPFAGMHADLFVRDMLLGVTRRVGTVGFASMFISSVLDMAFTADGSALAFVSTDSGLVAGDTNGAYDLFIIDLRHNAPVPQTYCSATTNSLGCAPSITSSGVPSPATNYTFSVSATGARNQRTGALLWSFTTGQTPFFGGTLCLGSPLRFLPARSTQGRALGTNDCSGWRSEWFTPAAMAAHGWTIGANVHAQFAFRDPGLPAGSLSLSNALQFQILP